MSEDSADNSDIAHSGQDKALARVAGWLKDSRCAVLTGAGISKESGIPTFRDRDKMTGLWEKYDPSELATPGGFTRNPALVWQWYDYRRKLVAAARPNAGHLALVELEKYCRRLSVITQNVDRLHLQAGTEKLLELHGNILTFRCFNRGHQAEDVPMGLSEPPACHHDNCRSLLRPNVVWFGESLPPDILSHAAREAASCEVFLVIGTSGLVQPAASLPFTAARAGAKLVEINPDETPLTEQVDVFLKGTAGKILPALIAQLKTI